MIGLVCYLAVAGLMLGIGIAQVKSKKPVGFYTGEEPPREEEISDVKAWNNKHGLMWILYGVIIMASYGIGAAMGDTVWSVLPLLGGVLLPLLLMIWCHHKLTKRYRH